MTTHEISNADDVIDLRDVIERYEELEQQEDRDETETEELATLKSLLEELKGEGGDEKWRGDWYPVTLIRDSYFENYMDDMLEDIGEIPKNLPPYLKITIDYDALRMDYTTVCFDGEDYLCR